MKTERRDFLKKIALAGLTSAIGINATFAGDKSLEKSFNSKKKRALRIAHITDVHLLPKPIAESCFAKVLKELNTMKDKPDLILNTGDSVMEMNKQSKENVEKMVSLWQKIMQAENKIEIKSALGNHDVWYGKAEEDEAYKKDPLYGKNWAIKAFNMPSRYYSFEKEGWYFIALDSINGKAGYQLDDEQFEWLKGELKKIPADMPVCVFNHVPILSICSWLYYAQRTEDLSQLKFPTGDIHVDFRRIKDAFYQSKNVKLCLSGHVHHVDAIDYLGTKYLCNGAVSGNWWGQPITVDEFPPVYTIIDLFKDGSVEYKNVYYDVKI